MIEIFDISSVLSGSPAVIEIGEPSQVLRLTDYKAGVGDLRVAINIREGEVSVLVPHATHTFKAFTPGQPGVDGAFVGQTLSDGQMVYIFDKVSHGYQRKG